MKKILTILSVFIVFALHAQVLAPKHENVRIPDLKTKTIFFVLPGGDTDKDFRDMVSKTWTITPFKIITQEEITQNLSTKNVFFTNAYAISNGFNGAGSLTSSSEYMMWCPRQKMVDRGKEIKNLDISFVEPYFTIKIEGDYWYAGIFKNFLQQMQDYMTTYLAKGKADVVSDPAKIADLKSSTLYVPDYVLKKEKAADLFSKYTGKYEVVSSEALNKKIMAGENIYYLLTCIYGKNCKIISVINSKTGQLVYNSLDAKPTYPYLRKDDIADISKEAEKAGK
ncbi:MAG TPA: hypothetical protein VNZ86_17910 [Bacteroidia bacterium]|nr:hypothetical protein [Bacteroidia bacterium]